MTGFQFGNPKLNERGFSCCGKPVGCQITHEGCAYLRHPWKRANVFQEEGAPCGAGSAPVVDGEHVAMRCTLPRHPLSVEHEMKPTGQRWAALKADATIGEWRERAIALERELAEAREMQRLLYDENVELHTHRGEAWRFLGSIATAKPESEQAKWMVEQARTGLKRSGHD